MASFLKTNPKIDGNSSSFFGKFPDYVELNFGNTAATANMTSSWNLGPNGAWPLVLQTIEQTGTIEVLGALTSNCVLISQNGGNANIGVRMLTTGVNADSAVALQTAIQSLGLVATANGAPGFAFSNVNLSGVTVSAVTIADVVGLVAPYGGQAVPSTFIF